MLNNKRNVLYYYAIATRMCCVGCVGWWEIDGWMEMMGGYLVETRHLHYIDHGCIVVFVHDMMVLHTMLDYPLTHSPPTLFVVVCWCIFMLSSRLSTFQFYYCSTPNLRSRISRSLDSRRPRRDGFGGRQVSAAGRQDHNGGTGTWRILRIFFSSTKVPGESGFVFCFCILLTLLTHDFLSFLFLC